ncbi:MAG TPA: hypothetical protein VFW12_09165 [Candidatus Limnocylindria bacterium]|nr:hypothetical protein [Candidatus Limnocylindria bacterium]
MKRFVLTIVVSSLAFGNAAAASGPTLGPEAGPGCFGKWRAGSVQWINENGLGPVGLNFFSVRKADNATINASNRATCAALS